MLDHLFDRYGNLMAINVQECKTRLNEPFNPDNPITLYFQKLEDEQQVSNNGGVPVLQEQLLQTALFAFFSAGVFVESCKRWEEMAPADKTWANLKTHFLRNISPTKHSRKSMPSRVASTWRMPFPPTQ